MEKDKAENGQFTFDRESPNSPSSTSPKLLLSIGMVSGKIQKAMA